MQVKKWRSNGSVLIYKGLKMLKNPKTLKMPTLKPYIFNALKLPENIFIKLLEI